MPHERSILLEVAEVREACKEIFRKADNWLKSHGGMHIATEEEVPIRLTLCGTYNSGKSTLVNAILGEQKALTGDSPVTKKAHDYIWRGYNIVDLPGYDAQEVDSEIARKEVSNADAVLYVISSQSGLDHQGTWKDLESLSANRVPFLVIVNDKQPAQDDEQERARRETIQRNYFAKATERLNQETTNTIHWVRANRAEKGRLENKPELVRRSGIEQLEADILRNLGGHNGVIARLLKHTEQYERALKTVQDRLSQQMETSIDKELSALLKNCAEAREHLQNKATVLQQNFNSLQDFIVATQERKMQGECSEINLAEKVASTYAEEIASFEGIAKERVKSIYDQLKKDVADAGINPEQLKVTFRPIDEVGNNADETTGSVAAEGVKSILKILAKELGKDTVEQATKEVAKEIAKEVVKESGKQGIKETVKEAGKQGAKEVAKETLKETAEQGAKEIAKETGKEVGKKGGKEIFKKGIGPAIEIIDALMTASKGWDKAAKEKARKEAILKQASAHTTLIINRVKQKYDSVATAYVNTLLLPLEKAIRESVEEQKKGKAYIMQDYTCGNEVLQNLSVHSAKMYSWLQRER